MKYILILLVSFVFGQDLTLLYKPEWVVLREMADQLEMDSQQDIKPETVITEALLNKNIGKFITVQIVLEYTEECYNDTINFDRYVYGPNLIIWDSLNIDITEYSPYDKLERKGYEFIKKDKSQNYYFRRKPTFKGFIEWIEK